jgi:hypothetical protein
MAGLEAMHQRFGEPPFQALLQPAIYYAETGVTLSPMLASYFPNRGKYLSRTPGGQAFLNQAGGLSPKPGDVFIQKDLAETLRAVAELGSSYMYTGEWGQQFVTAVKREGGKVSLQSAPPLLLNWEPGTPGEQFLDRAVAVPEGAYTPQFLEKLRASGITVAQKSKREAFRGTAVLATLDPEQDIARSVEPPGYFWFCCHSLKARPMVTRFVV